MRELKFDDCTLNIILHRNESLERWYLNEPDLDLHIVQESGSRVKIHVLALPDDAVQGARHGMNRITVEHAGEGCETEIYGLAYLRGDDALTIETHVHHTVGGGCSHQLVKFVLDDQAKGHFVGDLRIQPDAQHTEAHQTNRNLLLSEHAEMRTQPQLEIYADDVQATHGASTGQLDETALFYMQQRGISKQKARQLLVGAFMREVLDTMDMSSIPSDSPVRALLDSIDGVVE